MSSDRRVATLERRVKALEAQIAEGITAAAVGDVVPLAVPPDVADGQVITAAHINAIKASVNTWQSDVNMNDKSLIVYAAGGNYIRDFLDVSGGHTVAAYINNARVVAIRDNTMYWKLSTAQWDPTLENASIYMVLVSNTQLQLRVRGTDGVVRSATLTLA